MYKVPLSKTKLETKLAIVRESIEVLQKMGEEFSQENFVANKIQFAASEHYLRRALEAVFDIGGHIVSRFAYSPGKRPKTVKEIAREMGVRGVVDMDFATGVLVEMGGYRNRLVHFYDEITPKELYKIIAEDLGDLEFFATAVIKVINRPEELDLSIEE